MLSQGQADSSIVFLVYFYIFNALALTQKLYKHITFI